MNIHTADQINELFYEGLDSGDMQKQAAATSAYVKEKIREMSFFDKILPPKTITKHDLDQREDDQPMKWGNIQPNATAFMLNFRGQAEDHYLEGKKYQIVFEKLASQRIHKQAIELMTYRYAIVKEIEEIIIKEMAERRDNKFIESCEVITAATGLQVATGGGIPFGREAVNVGLDLFVDERVPCGTILCNRKSWNAFNALTKASDDGDAVASEMLRTGYQMKKIMNYDVIVTEKPINPANPTEECFWMFAPPNYLGENYVLNRTKFQIKNEEDMITMSAWGYYGAGIGNRRGIVKVTITP